MLSLCTHEAYRAEIVSLLTVSLIHMLHHLRLLWFQQRMHYVWVKKILKFCNLEQEFGTQNKITLYYMHVISVVSCIITHTDSPAVFCFGVKARCDLNGAFWQWQDHMLPHPGQGHELHPWQSIWGDIWWWAHTREDYRIPVQPETQGKSFFSSRCSLMIATQRHTRYHTVTNFVEFEEVVNL